MNNILNACRETALGALTACVFTSTIRVAAGSTLALAYSSFGSDEPGLSVYYEQGATYFGLKMDFT